jgi:hypothetical protein
MEGTNDTPTDRGETDFGGHKLVYGWFGNRKCMSALHDSPLSTSSRYYRKHMTSDNEWPGVWKSFGRHDGYTIDE